MRNRTSPYDTAGDDLNVAPLASGFYEGRDSDIPPSGLNMTNLILADEQTFAEEVARIGAPQAAGFSSTA